MCDLELNARIVYKKYSTAITYDYAVLSDIFGKVGTELIDGLLSGKNIGTILKDVKNKKLMAKSAGLDDVVQGMLSENDHFMLELIMRVFKDLNEWILQMEQCIVLFVNKDFLNVICFVLGIGLMSGVTILAEFGVVGRFNNERQVSFWAGFVLFLCQLVGTSICGRITKCGSKCLRWIMVEVAHSVVMCVCRFWEMFLRVSVKKGWRVAYVVVARKLLIVIWYLFVNCEKYVEEGFSKKVVRVWSAVGVAVGLVSLEDMIVTLRNAGFVVSKG